MSLLGVFESTWYELCAVYLVLIVLSAVWSYVTRPGFDVHGAHVLITGGSSGLGLALAHKCVRGGADTVTVVARNEERLRLAKRELEVTRASCDNGSAVQKVLALRGDVTSFEDMQRVVGESERAHHGPVDVLVCNAGLAMPGYFLEQDVSVFRKEMDVNYFGVVNVTKAALPGMAKFRSGTVVIVGSAMSLLGFIGYSQYAASKWAVRGLADVMRNEFIRHGVRVALFLPSNMKTAGFEEEEKTKPKETREIEGKGMLSSPDDSAQRLIDGLASGNYITTEETIIDIARMATAGTTPRRNTMLEILVAPFVTIFGAVFRLVIDMHVSPAQRQSKVD